MNSKIKKPVAVLLFLFSISSGVAYSNCLKSMEDLANLRARPHQAELFAFVTEMLSGAESGTYGAKLRKHPLTTHRLQNLFTIPASPTVSLFPNLAVLNLLSAARQQANPAAAMSLKEVMDDLSFCTGATTTTEECLTAEALKHLSAAVGEFPKSAHKTRELIYGIHFQEIAKLPTDLASLYFYLYGAYAVTWLWSFPPNREIILGLQLEVFEKFLHRSEKFTGAHNFMTWLGQFRSTNAN